MKNTLTDLNNYLFEAIERINDDELDDAALEREIQRSEAITKVAGVIINNANVQLQAIKHMDEYGYKGEHAMPALLTGRTDGVGGVMDDAEKSISSRTRTVDT